MLPAAALLIDGSNLYHSLKADNQLPFGAERFEQLFKQLDARFELKSICFYDSLKDRIRDSEGYARQQRFHSSLRNLKRPLSPRTRRLRYAASVRREQLEEKAMQIGIVDKCKEKLWDLLRSLGLVRITHEKGIDVMLAIDAVELAKNGAYGTIIILSGDADFVPAVNLIQSFGVPVVNLHLYHGSSTELRMACEQHILIDFDEEGVSLKD